MSHLVVRPLKLDARKCVRWATLILPLFLCGCFENPQKTKQSLQSKEYGISSIGRFFTFYQDASSTKAVETANRPSFSPYLFDTADFSESAGYSIEEAVALPDFVAAGREGFAGAPSSARVSEAAFGRTGREQSASFRNAVSLVFNAPFSRVFSSVFEQSADLEKDEVLDSEKAEEPNPFTAALQKEKSAKTDEVPDRKEAVAQEKDDTDEQKDPSVRIQIPPKLRTPITARRRPFWPFPIGIFYPGDFDVSGVCRPNPRSDRAISILSLRMAPGHSISISTRMPSQGRVPSTSTTLIWTGTPISWLPGRNGFWELYCWEMEPVDIKPAAAF